MKPIMSIERRSAILELANKRTDTIGKLMDGNHVDGLEEILRLVDRPVGTHEETRNATEEQHINAISEWYDLIGKACHWVHHLGLTMADHVPVHWFDEATGEIQWDYADELLLGLDERDVEYKGQQLFAGAIDYFGIVTAKELQTAIMECDVEEAKRLLNVIKQAMEDYI